MNIIALILTTSLSLAHASQSSSSFEVSFTVPVVCGVVNNEPICNLILKKIDSNTWADDERGYKIIILENIITIETL